MHFSYNPYALFPALAAAISMFLALRCWRYRRDNLSRTFLILMLAVAWWSACITLEHLSIELAAKVFWVKASYFGIVCVPAGWLVFIVRYTDRAVWLGRRRLALLAALPFMTLVAVWTNDAHHLVWRSIWLDSSVTPPVDAVVHGPLFWVYAVFAYSALLLGTLMLFTWLKRSHGVLRKQAGVLLAGSLMPWAANCLFLAGVGPFRVVDPTALSFALTGTVFYWGLTKLQLLDMLPAAHETIFRSMADGVIVLDTRWRIVELNPAAERIVGRPRKEAVGKSYPELMPGQAGLLDLRTDSPEERAVVAMGEGDRLRYYQISLTPMKARQRVDGYVIVFHDDTERNRAEVELRARVALETELEERRRANEAMRRLNSQLEARVEERTRQLQEAVSLANASSQAKSDFLASMSHELRTPLNAIIGFSQILQERYFGDLNEKQAEYVDDIVSSGKHLLSLINDILDLSKIEAGKMDLEFSQVRIADLLRNSLVMVKEKALAHRISLEVSLSDYVERAELPGDERKLKQVMFNLLSNAAKFTPDGGSISVAARMEANDVVVQVSDTGIGMTEQELGRLFEPFYQASGGIKGKTPGTGLGLAITKSIVEKHGGRITAESAGPGKGSRFTFTLPVHAPASVSQASED